MRSSISMRSVILALLLPAFTCLAGVSQNRENGNAESDRLLSLESIWNEAEVRHNARALDMLLADTFSYTDSDGSFMDRAQWLAHVKSRVDDYEQLGNSAMAVHVYGNLAIVTGKYVEKLRQKGRAVTRNGRFTDTWIRQNSEWKCVASQATLIGN
jgi:hypothetical protein